jgi:hypothetical protein
LDKAGDSSFSNLTPELAAIAKGMKANPQSAESSPANSVAIEEVTPEVLIIRVKFVPHAKDVEQNRTQPITKGFRVKGVITSSEIDNEKAINLFLSERFIKATISASVLRAQHTFIKTSPAIPQ